MRGMEIIVIPLVGFLVSGLTFFSGFGLGTLLLPAFVAFFPVEVAVGFIGCRVSLVRRELYFRFLESGAGQTAAGMRSQQSRFLG